MKKISIIMAMAREAEPIIEALKLSKVIPPWNPKLPMRLYRGQVGSHDVTLTLCGKDEVQGVDLVATQPAVLAAYLTIEYLKPDLLINAGTAGGFQAMGAEIGDVYVGNDAVFFHDRRIPVKGFEAYGKGGYACHDFSDIGLSLGLKSGRISTGNSIDCSEKDLEIMKANKVAVKDMEAAAIAWVASLLYTPVMYLKAITDLVDHHEDTSKQFETNFNLAIGMLEEAVVEVLASHMEVV